MASSPPAARLPSATNESIHDEPDALGTGSLAKPTSPSKISGSKESQSGSALYRFLPGKVTAPEPLPPPVRAIPRDSLLINSPDSVNHQYFMNHQSRGVALIINNAKFDKSIGLQERFGTDVDASALEDMFQTLGFTSGNILRYNDVTCRNMLKLMQHYAAMDFTSMDCFFCAILSHGKEGTIFAYDGKTSLETLMEPFKKRMHPSLIGKPKVFLIQACRGEQFDEGQELLKPDSDDHVQRIPLEADFLYAYSTVPGYYSWRNAVRGSWFVQAFVKNVKEHKRKPDIDMVRLLTRVNHDVAYHFQSNVPDDKRMHLKKQMPSIVSMLTKELFFH